MRTHGRPKTPRIEKERKRREEGRGTQGRGETGKKGGRDVVGRVAFEQVYKCALCAGIRAL